jgi:hypothetical protein
VISQLKKHLRESEARCKTAEDAVNEAQKRLDVVLTSGRDTATAREVLKKAKELLRNAQYQHREISKEIDQYYSKRDAKRAKEITATSQDRIAELLRPFDLSKFTELLKEPAT